MHRKFEQLLSAAIQSTNHNKLMWQAIDGETFRTNIGAGMLRIGRGTMYSSTPNGEPEPASFYSIWVFDNLGRIIEEVELKESIRDQGYELADELFKAARRSAYSGNQVIDAMLSVLGAAAS